MQKLLKNIYLVSAAIFFIISILGFVLGKSLPAFIAGTTISLLCVVFNFVFKPKWSEEAKKSLLDSFETIKVFGNNLPFSIIGKLQMVFIIIMFICLLQSIISIIIPSFPTFILVVLSNIAFSLYLLGTFYSFLQGNLTSLIKTTKLFAIYQIIDVFFTFFTESFKVSTKGMCLFLAFYSLSYLISFMTSETDPSLEENKPKKDKKKKKDKDNKEEEVKQVENIEENKEVMNTQEPSE